MNTETTHEPVAAPRATRADIGVNMAAPLGLIILASATLTTALLSFLGAIALAVTGML